MGTISETYYTTSPTFSIDRLTTCKVLLDGTQNHEPEIAIYSDSNELLHFGNVSSFEKAFGTNVLPNLLSDQLVFLVPVLDAQIVPNELVEAGGEDLVAKFVLDDGVTPAKTAKWSEQDARFVYRERLVNLAPYVKLHPTALRIPFPKIYLEQLRKKSLNSSSVVYGVHVGHESVYLAIFQSGKLYYFNEFQVNNIEDFNYYFIKVMEQLPSNTTHFLAYLSGDIKEGDELHQRIVKYTEEIYFAEKLSCALLAVNTRD